MPAVEEANDISEELDKRVKFEIILISPQMLKTMQTKAEVRFAKKLNKLFKKRQFLFNRELIAGIRKPQHEEHSARG